MQRLCAATLRDGSLDSLRSLEMTDVMSSEGLKKTYTLSCRAKGRRTGVETSLQKMCQLDIEFLDSGFVGGVAVGFNA